MGTTQGKRKELARRQPVTDKGIQIQAQVGVRVRTSETATGNAQCLSNSSNSPTETPARAEGNVSLPLPWHQGNLQLLWVFASCCSCSVAAAGPDTISLSDLVKSDDIQLSWAALRTTSWPTAHAWTTTIFSLTHSNLILTLCHANLHRKEGAEYDANKKVQKHFRSLQTIPHVKSFPQIMFPLKLLVFSLYICSFNFYTHHTGL